MAVCGRQLSKYRLSFQQAISASAAAKLVCANSRVSWTVDNPCAVAMSRNPVFM